MKWVAFKGWEESQKIATAAAGRGIRVHKAMSEFVLTGAVKVELNEEEAARVESGKKYLTDIGFKNNKHTRVEYDVWSVDGYSGQVDFFDGRGLLVDWKTATDYHDECDLQTAAYLMAHNEHNKPEAHRREVVRLLPTGYKRRGFKYCSIAKSYKAFLGCLEVFKWRYC